MEQDETSTLLQNSKITDSLIQIKKYLEKDIDSLRKELDVKNIELKSLEADLENVQHLTEGNRQLINKLLGDLSKLQNDIGWYKRTYEQRSFLGTIREKIRRKFSSFFLL